MSNTARKEKLRRFATIFKALGHPARICIVCRLMRQDCNVSKLQSCLELPQSTVSQHLAVLKARGIIEGKRHGVEVIYSIIDEDVKKILETIFDLEEIAIV